MWNATSQTTATVHAVLAGNRSHFMIAACVSAESAEYMRIDGDGPDGDRERAATANAMPGPVTGPAREADQAVT